MFHSLGVSFFVCLKNLWLRKQEEQSDFRPRAAVRRGFSGCHVSELERECSECSEESRCSCVNLHVCSMLYMLEDRSSGLDTI